MFNNSLPTHTKHAKKEILYLVQGIPCPRKDVLKLEPNTEVEITTYDKDRPNAGEDTVRQGRTD